jgi:hypothetical protein
MGKKKKLKASKSQILLHHFGYLKNLNSVDTKLDYYEKLNNRQIEVTDGQDPRPYFNLALHFRNYGKDKEAVTLFQKALEVSPKMYHAHIQMAALNISSAKNFLTNAMNSMPSTHPFRPQAQRLLKFLDENSFGTVEVGNARQGSGISSKEYSRVS